MPAATQTKDIFRHMWVRGAFVAGVMDETIRHSPDPSRDLCGHTLRFCDGKMLMLVTVTF